MSGQEFEETKAERAFAGWLKGGKKWIWKEKIFQMYRQR